MVGAAGFEPTASSSRTKRATRLRHAPTGRWCAGVLMHAMMHEQVEIRHGRRDCLRNTMACAPPWMGYVSDMRAMPCICKALVAAMVALSLGVFSPALALTNPEPPCCCQVRDGCEKNSTQSSCLCPACPSAHHAIPMAIMAESKCIQPLHEPAFRWSFRNEWAAGRRSAPPVPPPRVML
ncbi:MAG: hypothetical protein RLZ22_1000 [Verrucomicrobiota bacterium]